MGAFEPGLLQRIEPPRRVVVVRASRLGDFICATPALRSLRAALPDAEITLIALPYVRDLVERCPSVDRFVPFPGYPGIAEQFFDARRLSAHLAAMQDEQFDLAIQMHGSGANSNPYTLMLGAGHTAGWVRPGEGAGLLDAGCPYPSLHEVDRTLALVTFLGAPDCGRGLELPPRREERAEVEALLRGHPGPFIGVHTGARDAVKRWFPDRFEGAALRLQAEMGGTILLLGDAEERERAALLAENLGRTAVNLSGALSLAALCAVIDRCAVLLTNDSGPAHIAYALRVPSVTIFGGTDPAEWAAADRNRHPALAHPVPCRPCPHRECPIGYPCLLGVDVDAVLAAAMQAMQVQDGAPRGAERAPSAARPRSIPG